jgi:hypothetical protein
MYVATVEVLRKKERQGEIQELIKIDGFLNFTPPLNANVLFCMFLRNFIMCVINFRVFGVVFS